MAVVLTDAVSMNDEEYFKFCMAHEGLQIERTAARQIVIMPLGGFSTAYRSGDLSGQLGNWAKTDGRGVAVNQAGVCSRRGYSISRKARNSGSCISVRISWLS